MVYKIDASSLLIDMQNDVSMTKENKAEKLVINIFLFMKTLFKKMKSN